MCMQKSITIFFTVLEIGPFSLFQGPGRASTDKKCQFAISWARSCQYQYLRKSLSKYSTQFKRYGHFHHFQNLALGKAPTDDKCHFVIPWARSFQHQIVCKTLSKYSKRFNGSFSLFLCLFFFFFFFFNLNRGKTDTNPKCHLTISWATTCQFTNVYAKFHHNIPLGLRDRAIFTFSEFGTRQNLNR